MRGSDPPPHPPTRSCLLTISKRELEAGHPPRNGDLSEASDRCPSQLPPFVNRDPQAARKSFAEKTERALAEAARARSSLQEETRQNELLRADKTRHVKGTVVAYVLGTEQCGTDPCFVVSNISNRKGENVWRG